MVASTASEVVQTLRIEKQIVINAPIEIAFEAILEELGPANELMNGTPMPMVLEPFPGGRWFRDLGQNTGHFWGHVQVIKPPKLLEICGPLFMSYPSANHIQYRLEAEGLQTRLSFLHRAIGEIAPDHREGVNAGWGYKMERLQTIAAAKLKSR
jgi:hypothetical protein